MCATLAPCGVIRRASVEDVQRLSESSFAIDPADAIPVATRLALSAACRLPIVTATCGSHRVILQASLLGRSCKDWFAASVRDDDKSVSVLTDVNSHRNLWATPKGRMFVEHVYVNGDSLDVRRLTAATIGKVANGCRSVVQGGDVVVMTSRLVSRLVYLKDALGTMPTGVRNRAGRTMFRASWRDVASVGADFPLSAEADLFA